MGFAEWLAAMTPLSNPVAAGVFTASFTPAWAAYFAVAILTLIQLVDRIQFDLKFSVFSIGKLDMPEWVLRYVTLVYVAAYGVAMAAVSVANSYWQSYALGAWRLPENDLASLWKALSTNGSFLTLGMTGSKTTLQSEHLRYPIHDHAISMPLVFWLVVGAYVLLSGLTVWRSSRAMDPVSRLLLAVFCAGAAWLPWQWTFLDQLRAIFRESGLTLG